MKVVATLWATLYFLISAAIMQVEPPELPAGAFCSPRGVVSSDGHVMDGAHPCHCEHMTHSKDCEGGVEENNKCTQWCHKDHCHCPVMCDPIDPATGSAPEDN